MVFCSDRFPGNVHTQMIGVSRAFTGPKRALPLPPLSKGASPYTTTCPDRNPKPQGYNETVIKPDPKNLSSYYYSQYGQDAFLEEFVFKKKLKEGFFVEAGAGDGVLDSNTLVNYYKMILQWLLL